jgi:hypothetical protein
MTHYEVSLILLRILKTEDENRKRYARVDVKTLLGATVYRKSGHYGDPDCLVA